MSFVDAIKTCFSNYVTFAGRAGRPEYWYWVLFTFIATMCLSLIYDALGAALALATMLPTLAVGSRRLHDADSSAWWLLLLLIPLVGTIILLIMMCRSGTPGTNRFGDPPATSATPLTST